MDVSREFGLLPIGNFLRIALLTTVTAMIARNIFLSDLGVVGDVLQSVGHFFAERLLLVLAILGAFGALVLIPIATKSCRRLRDLLKRWGSRV